MMRAAHERTSGVDDLVTGFDSQTWGMPAERRIEEAWYSTLANHVCIWGGRTRND